MSVCNAYVCAFVHMHIYRNSLDSVSIDACARMNACMMRSASNVVRVCMQRMHTRETFVCMYVCMYMCMYVRRGDIP